MSAPMNYLDGNAAAGELSRVFAMDITSAEGQCANCGAKERFRRGAFICAVSPASSHGVRFAGMYCSDSLILSSTYTSISAV